MEYGVAEGGGCCISSAEEVLHVNHSLQQAPWVNENDNRGSRRHFGDQTEDHFTTLHGMNPGG